MRYKRNVTEQKKVLENDGNLLVLVGCIIVNKAGLGYKYLSMSVVYYICNTTGEARFMFARNIKGSVLCCHLN